MRRDVYTDVLLGRADDLLLHGRAGQAATLLAPVVGEEPGNVDAWLLLARAHLALHQPGPALDAARAAVRLEPRGIESLYWVSVAYSTSGRHELAISAAATACGEDPGNPRLFERHGRALLQAGRTGEAVRVLATAAEIAHYDPDVHVAHGVALFAAGRPMSAREAYATALGLDPSHPAAAAEMRRLTDAERRIVDAGTLVRVTDEFAEAQRVPAGGTRPPASMLAYLSSVVFAVCMVAGLMIGVLDRFTDLPLPITLTLSLLCAAAAAGCVAVLTRRT
jgi:Flp pilus assembly protein TadD